MSIEYQQYKNVMISITGDESTNWKNRLSYDLTYVEGGIEIAVNTDLIEAPFEANICGVKLVNLSYSSTLILSAIIESVIDNVVKIRVNKQVAGLTMECENDDVTILLEIVAV